MSVRCPRLPEAQKNVVSTKQPTSSLLVNFLNNYFANFRFADEFPNQTIRFRSLTEKNTSAAASKHVIDIAQCEPFTAYSNVCAQLQHAHPNAKLTKDELAAITQNVFDGRLRGLLSIAATAVIKQDKPKQQRKKASSDESSDQQTDDKKKQPRLPSENAFEKYVLPALQLGKPRAFNAGAYIDALNDFFKNTDKLRLRAYNICFPHSLRKEGEAVGVNCIYLQRVIRYHEEVLKAIVSNSNEQNILSFVQSQFVKDFNADTIKKGKQTLSPEELIAIKEQLSNPEFIANVLNSQSQNGKVDEKWLDSIVAIKVLKGGKFQQLERTLSKQEKVAVKRLLSELYSTLSFIKLVRNAFEHNKSFDPSECYERYIAMLAEIDDFYKSHKPKSRENKDFIRYLVESVVFIGGNNVFNYGKNHLRCFISDVNSKLPIKLSVAVRSRINEAIAGKRVIKHDKKEEVTVFKSLDEAIAIVVDEFEKSIQNDDALAAYDVNKLDIYCKIGKFIPAAIGKQYRIAIGILLVQYLLEQIKLQRAMNRKKKDIVIYVKA